MTPEHQQMLADHLKGDAYGGKARDEAYAAFHSRPPVKSETVQKPRPMTITGVISLLSQASVARLVVNPNLTDIRDKIQQQDYQGIALWGGLLAAGGQITPDELAAIQAALSATDSVTVVTETGPAPIEVLSMATSGFPNRVTADEFAAAWSAAGRN